MYKLLTFFISFFKKTNKETKFIFDELIEPRLSEFILSAMEVKDVFRFAEILEQQCNVMVSDAHPQVSGMLDSILQNVDWISISITIYKYIIEHEVK
jgi:hypothetical protein